MFRFTQSLASNIDINSLLFYDMPDNHCNIVHKFGLNLDGPKTWGKSILAIKVLKEQFVLIT